MAIKEHLDNEGDNPEVQILTIESKGLLEQLNIWELVIVLEIK